MRGEFKKINKLTTEEIAQCFHSRDSDSCFLVKESPGDEYKKITCRKENKKVYVTSNCKSASAVTKIVADGKEGEEFSIDDHGIESLVKSDDIPKLVHSLSTPRPKSKRREEAGSEGASPLGERESLLTRNA